jgi:hypothetical protein
MMILGLDAGNTSTPLDKAKDEVTAIAARAAKYRKAMQELCDSMDPSDRQFGDGESLQDSIALTLARSIAFDLTVQMKLKQLMELAASSAIPGKKVEC